MRRLRSLPVLALALLIAGCAQYAAISERRPQFRPVRTALASIQQPIERAAQEEKRKPLDAIGELLTAAEAAERQLARNPNDTAARDAYNFAVARVVGM